MEEQFNNYKIPKDTIGSQEKESLTIMEHVDLECYQLQDDEKEKKNNSLVGSGDLKLNGKDGSNLVGPGQLIGKFSQKPTSRKSLFSDKMGRGGGLFPEERYDPFVNQEPDNDIGSPPNIHKFNDF